MVAGANLNNIYFSNDGGETWTKTAVDCPWGIWGDPVIGVDTMGAFYYLHLANPPGGNWIDRIIAQKSTDGGETWSDGSYMGLNGAKAQDKHWIAVDRQTNHLYVTWTQFDDYGSSNVSDKSIIRFSKSTDGGETWTEAKTISEKAGDCIDDDDTTEGAVPTIGPNGEVFVTWSYRDTLWFDRSLDGGETWLDEDIFVAEHIGGWAQDIPGIYRANGFPVTITDLSGGPHHGAIYVNFTDQRNGEDDTDVWLVKSTDGGDTWDSPKRVNDDAPGKHQFFTWMAVDQATGWLWFVFYDRRNYEDNQTDVFMAVSRDGGETFQNFKVSENSFLPTSNVFFGDYTNISAHNNVVRPIWTRLAGGNLSIWTALVDTEILTNVNEPRQENPFFTLENPYPNPTIDEVTISFKLRRRSLISLSVVNFQGRTVAQPIQQEWMDYGGYVEKLEMKEMGLLPGEYFLILEVDGRRAKRKLIRAK